ncbi:MAG TPA: class I SAM-dependent RNA methyltransferase [Verrucomicrobiae bacterium]
MIAAEAGARLEVGQRCRLRITDIAFGGEGVARVGEFVVFVPFVIVGEAIEAEITEVKKSFARAKLLRVLEPSGERVQPRCPYFMACGGCQYQHISYAEQLEIKHKQISDLFQRVGRLETTIQPVAGSPREYGYRNRIMVRTQWNKPEQRLNIGFIRYDNRFVEDIDHCPISEPEVSEGIKRVRANPPPKGGLKVVLRKMPEGWDVPQDSFFQNNFFLLPELVSTVRTFFKDSGSRFLIDLYCGVGFFGIELADLATAFLGVELDKKAIQSARRNAATRGISNGDFQIGPAEELLPHILKSFPPSSTTVLIDPPRTGCPAASLELLRETKPQQIIYVSCHPATLARDLNVLCAGGVYEVTRVKPLDMFPQTQHVECVADVRLLREIPQ